MRLLALALCQFVFLSSHAVADVRNDYRACEQGFLRRLKPGFSPQASTPEDQYCLGLGYWFQSPGNRLPRDPAAAAKWHMLAAEAGHPAAQTALGYHYEKGYGVPQDTALALKWYRKAADSGDSSAMFNLGRLASLGRGVPQDKETAQKLFDRAESLGSSEARVNRRRTRQYDEFEAPKREIFQSAFTSYQAKDYDRAAELYATAAAAGNVSAQVALAQLHLQGLGVPKDTTRAVTLLRQAADRGHSKAQAHLGYCYELGEGVEENWREAVVWYRKSAEQLDPFGLLLLGRAYQFGIAVPQDRAEAVRLFQLGENQGDPQAGFFARWLSRGRSCLGYRDDVEREKFAGVCSDPKGLTFASSAKRFAWLAETMSKVDVNMFGGGDGGYTAGACKANGGSFRSGNCYGYGGVFMDPYGSQDPYGRNLW